MKYHGSIQRTRDDVLRETEKRTISELLLLFFFKNQLTQTAHRRFGGGGGEGVGGFHKLRQE